MSNPLLDVTDADIEALSPDERRALIFRLSRRVEVSLPKSVPLDRVRRIRLTLLTLCTVSLIPWTIYLALTLPRRYYVENWSATWVGFDLTIAAFMGLSVVLGVLRRLPVVLFSFTTGVLLLTDAWFDVMTARHADFPAAAAAALLAEIPLGLVLVGGAWWMMRLTAIRLWALEPGESLWRLRVE